MFQQLKKSIKKMKKSTKTTDSTMIPDVPPSAFTLFQPSSPILSQDPNTLQLSPPSPSSIPSAEPTPRPGSAWMERVSSEEHLNKTAYAIPTSKRYWNLAELYAAHRPSSAPIPASNISALDSSALHMSPPDEKPATEILRPVPQTPHVLSIVSTHSPSNSPSSKRRHPVQSSFFFSTPSPSTTSSSSSSASPTRTLELADIPPYPTTTSPNSAGTLSSSSSAPPRVLTSRKLSPSERVPKSTVLARESLPPPNDNPLALARYGKKLGPR